MCDDELKSILRAMNPWWHASATGGDPLGWTGSDTKLVAANRLKIDYRPPTLDDIVDGGLYVIRGPRRVGKSVALIRFIAERIAADPTVPMRAIYLALDDFDDRSLRRALALGRELTRSAQDHSRIWLLDEVTAVEGWPAILKSARDNTPFGFDTVIVTGSSAHGLTEARRALGPGRVGLARDPFRIMLPMTFGDFAKVSGRKLPSLPRMRANELQSEAAREALEYLDPVVDELDLAWQAYCEVGGFPRAVAEFVHHGSPSPEFCRDLLDWLAPDIGPDDPPESVARLLSQLSFRSSNPLNVADTAESLLTTGARLRTRLNRLYSTLAAIQCPQVDEDGQPVAGSRSKLYLIDPLLSRLTHLRDAGFPQSDITKITEAQLAITLARSVERDHPGRLLESRAIGYSRSGGGTEVDFATLPLLQDGCTVWTTPVESKWVSRKWRSQARAIQTRYNEGIVATKNIVDVSGDVWAVPVGALALMLS